MNTVTIFCISLRELTQHIATRSAGVILASWLFLLVPVGVASTDHGGRGEIAPAGTSLKEPFPMATRGLPKAAPTRVISLKNGEIYEMEVAPVRKRIDGHWVRLLAYNGSVPGPALRVPQGSEVVLRLHNRGDNETTLHSHGLRLENASDGVPGLTQRSLRIGETRDYRLKFPDPGIYWYHPHVRSDYALQSGLYGTIVVTPANPTYWSRVNREIVLALSDIALASSGNRLPFFRGSVDHVLMGRFGNTLLINGDTDYRLHLKRNETVRLYFTNMANTRLFNLAIPGARMKLVGADLGRYDHETSVQSVLLAPGQRRVVEMTFPEPGTYSITHVTPGKTYILGSVRVEHTSVAISHLKEFDALRSNGVGDLTILKPFYSREPDKVLTLTMAMDHSLMMGSASSHAMPGMEPIQAATEGDGQADGVEWEDPMPEMNLVSTSTTVTWKMVDQATGKENMAIDTWNFRRGGWVKIRLINDPQAMHSMQHPIHFHGQRFLVLATNGMRNENPVWQDTVLVPAGQTADILLDASNPGLWMAHCHIAEHAENGMMLPFRVQ